jgi:hypothetical protein
MNQPPTSKTLRTPMQITWQFDYEIDIAKLRNLYSKSKRAQWDAEDLDWASEIDPGKPLVDESRFRYDALPLMQRLSKGQKEAFRAHSAAHLLSQFLHGEQGALMTSAALTHAVPDYEGKLYAAQQTADEARHVAFGNVYVGETVRAMHADDREDVAQFSFEVVKMMADSMGGPSGERPPKSDPGFVTMLGNVGIDLKDFLTSLREANLAGIRAELPPGQVHSFRDLMMPALVRVGAVTPRTRELFEREGIPVWDDPTVLESMEDAETGDIVMSRAR